jgi:hypothetical protein
MTVIENATFKALVEEIGDIEPDSTSSFQLLMENGLPVLVKLDPNEKQIFIESTLFDLTSINAPTRSIITKSLLALNYLALGNKCFFIGLDNNQLVKVFSYCDLHKTDVEALLSLISSSTDQSIQIQQFITSLTSSSK